MNNIDFAKFEESSGFVFNNKDLLKQAFLHRSYINENPKVGISHNERLEFLGDAVIELIVTDFLYKNYPNEDEGSLTAYRSALVNAILMSEVATEIDMNSYLLLSKGELKDTGKARMYILANTFESFTGALYLDQGYDACERFLQKTLLLKIERIVKDGAWRDSKSMIQEKSQEIEHVTPSYQVLSESGPDHDKCFTIGIFFGETKIAEGKGKSKQEAEQQAATEALKAKKWNI